jgi:hypothetical protein
MIYSIAVVCWRFGVSLLRLTCNYSVNYVASRPLYAPDMYFPMVAAVIGMDTE